jgi:hypothetical protein
VELPPDIHPLPESVNAYVIGFQTFELFHVYECFWTFFFQFVYPFTLEPHVVALESSRRQTIAAHAARHEAYLRSRDDDKELRKRDALRRIAPGFEPHGGPLVPTRNNKNSMNAYEVGVGAPYEQPHQQSRSVMDDLIDQLAALESKHIG